MKIKELFLVFLGLCATMAHSQEIIKLESPVVLSDGSALASANAGFAFDGSLSASFESSAASHAWVGLDLGRAHVLKHIKWAPMSISEESDGYATLELGIFEGANKADFSDAIPLYMITEQGITNGFVGTDIVVTRGFRYVRYVGPNNSYGRIAEIEFYGYEGEGSDEQFYQPTNLPLVVIHQDEMKDPTDKVTLLPSHGVVIYTTKKGKSKIVGDSCTIRGRGNYSWRGLPKKPYRVKFENKVEMPRGGAKAKKWTLIPSYGDKTLMRNILAYDLSHRFDMYYTPYCQPVDLMLNGEYKGNYQLCDQLEVSKNRLNLEEMTAEDIEDENLTGAYFYEYDGQKNFKSLAEWTALSESRRRSYDVGFYTSVYNSPITVKSPDEDVMQQSQFDYLKGYLEQVEQLIEDESEELEEYFDFESFAKFFLISEFAANTDAFFETYQYKKRGDNRIYSGPIWDCDLCFDNDGRTHNYLNDPKATDWIFMHGGSAIEDWNSCGAMRQYANHLLNYETLTQKMEEEWAFARGCKYVTNDSILHVIDILADSLEQSQALNFKRWPILNTVVHDEYQALGSYEAEVGTIRNYIPMRMNWFDRKLNLTEESLEFEVTDAGWATIYSPIACVVPQGVSAYSIVGANDDNTLRFDTISAMYPNRPYIIKAAPGFYTLNGYSVNFLDGKTNGLLTGVAQDKMAPLGSYVLQNHDGYVAFYKVASYEVSVPSNHAYLTLPVSLSNSPARFSFDGEEASIEESMIELSYCYVYNISGQLVFKLSDGVTIKELESLLPNGLYIISDGHTTLKQYIGRR